MTTEAVIYVSLALVLLTRIYVFISPPEFLEEHKDRRYHEFHLYRQYHLHKQYDKDESDLKRLLGDQNDDDTSSLHSTSSTPNSRRRPYDVDSLLEALHHPADELVLLGSEPGARPFPLRQLSSHVLSRTDPIEISSPSSMPPTPTSASTTPHSPREGRGIWSRILGSSESSVPNYLSLDINEIHYNGSLVQFDQDAEVQESIQGLKAGVKDMTKECPTMTMVWESGRWCCLEGRTLYILRALEWKGQVRVRVLVDKDPMMLAVTEDYWKAAGMTSELTPLTPLTPQLTGTPSTTSPSTTTTSPTTPVTPLRPPHPNIADDSTKAHANYVRMVAATTDDGVPTFGLSLADEALQDSVQKAKRVDFSSQGPFSLSASESLSLPASPAGHDADDEEDDDDDDDESDRCSEGEEGDDEDENKKVEKSLDALVLDTKRPHRINTSQGYFDRRKSTTGSQGRANIVRSSSQRQKMDTDKVTMTAILSSNPPSPVLQGNLGRNISTGTVQQQFRRHERRISIPEFMLPPPLKDEQAYVIIDPSLPASTATTIMRENALRRDSGHAVSP
ncbi:hypothetical protein BGX27_010938 [Mortierella sp. AM989]|nr:hypothetical protein BGX27_010938 [Mortierella sp. AM989]